jgi:nitrite reductase/ring-hydroxylating ferredoxin subunit
LLHGVAVTVVGGIAGYVVALNSSAAKRKNGATTANAYGPSPPGGGHLLSELSTIPLGGGIVLPSAKIVLSRSPSGAVRGFSAVCTHQGCTVGPVLNGRITCPCHGSQFNALTGAVENGPATLPLPPVSVTVRNGGVYTT